MNNCIFMGRLTRDPEVKESNGKQYARFTLAVPRDFAKEGAQDTDFIDCVVFGKLSETVDKYFEKGRQIVVQGALHIDAYNNKDGERRYQTSLVVSTFNFTAGKGGGANAQSTEPSAAGFEYSGDEDEIPFA